MQTFTDKIVPFIKALRAIPLRGPSEFFFERARKLALKQFNVKANPMGLRNKKIQGPATYRQVGGSCPPCPYLEVCYAGGGNVALHARRASEEAFPALVSIAIALVATEQSGTPVRLHVSGDLCRDGVLDMEYVAGLLTLSNLYENRKGAWAWSYTHLTPADFEPHRLRLKEAGIVVLYSDRFEVGGAVIWPFDEIETLRADPGVTYAKCREQLDGTPCVSCDLCVKAREKGICIVFKPHGRSQKRVLEIARQVRVDYLLGREERA